MIEAVLFDVDGVLIDSHDANVAFYRDFLAGYGYHDLTETDLEHGHYRSLREAIVFLTRAPEETIEALYREARDLPGYRYDLLRVPDGCGDALAALGQTHALGIVTSRERFGIEHFYGFSGLQPHFRVAIGYEDTEKHKPDPEPLLEACRRLGVAPERTLYVGDAPGDLVCARAAGAHFVAYGEAIADADRVIRGFDALLPLLDEVMSSLQVAR
ncbi:MAG TPA: HAD family hydrolase [Dehalococcoidia bacterium]|nr:HAD family hydrolase [Dehalococcoidia bacterium]